MKKLFILTISAVCLIFTTKNAKAYASCMTPNSSYTWGYCEASGNGYAAESYYKSVATPLYLTFDFWLDNPVGYGERVGGYVGWPTSNPNGISSLNLGLYYDQDLVLYPRHIEYDDQFSEIGMISIYVEIVGAMYNSHYMKAEVWWPYM